MDYTVHVVLIVATFMVDTSLASRLPLSHTYTGHNSCRLPVTRGWGCIGRSQRWGYDNRQGTCVPFTYTGCNGNRNNFKTEDDCRRSCMQEVGKVPVITPVLEQSVRDPCELPHDNGGCYNSTTMWYYDVDSMTCFPFTYHGCGGNENRFSTRAICMGVCGPRTLEHQNELARDVMDFDELEGFEDLNAMPVCYLGISKGSCHSSHPRFFSENGVCKQFDYSGCKGNANNFATISDCEESCGTSTSSSTQTTITTTTTTTQDTPSTTTREVPRDCAVAPEYGSCDRSVMMYYYNSDTHSCGRFIWSGCGGNQNRFTTLRHCQSYCIDGITELPTTTTTTTEPTTRDPEVCNMPITTGPCRAYLPRFGYNSQSGNCEGFVFGGCRGNDNNFDTMEQCQAHCETRRTSTERVTPTETPTMPPTTTRVRREICTLPRVIGPCRMSIDRYWFNLSTEQCEYFVYGGCQGNANSFDTQAECEAVCVRETPTQDNGRNEQSTTEQPTPADVCLQPRVIGHCRMAIRSYWFNHETQQCERFIYGGCGGNGNRFETRQECESTCQDVPSTDGSGRAHQFSTVPPTPDTCSLPRVVGRCRAAIEMYWYNQQTNHCERFMYGGCEGNANRFDTVEECESACRTEEQTTAPVTAEHPTSSPVPVCMQPRAAGPCEAAIRAYWYNHETNQCERFTYGGCEGNDNRFSTRQECESTCRTTAGEPTERANPEIPVVSDDVCTQQRVVGPCRMAVDAYWYNHETLQCEHFVYGGCQGNGNRFNTLDECQSVCHTEERNVPIAAPGGDDSGDEDEGSGEEDELINEEQGSEEDACAIEPQGVGLCRMMILWFSYDPAENKCNEIRLGGCRAVGGFESMDECLNSCVTSRGPEGADEIASGNEDERSDDDDEGAETREEGRATYTVHEVCTLPSHSGGNCGRGTDDTQTRYHFVFNEADPEASRCEPFQYTGCGGNRNNFREEELCMEVCAGSWNE